ncbi:carboxypeptidase-like regulatory domain-containing protein [Deinococcus irradiatisoli]|nr:carboxypeptidase-like regulatory domain-containing protein [Deinococcus irradiatisoli]
MIRTLTFWLACTVSGVWGVGLAQPTSQSWLVNVALPAGAILVTDADATKEFAGVLRGVATSAGSSCQRSEYLVWQAGAGDLQRQFTRALLAQGYSYSVVDESDEEDGQATAFRLEQGGPKLVGLWVKTKDADILGWCLLSSEAKAPAPAAPTTPAQAPRAPTTATAAGPQAPAATAKSPVPKPGYVSGVVLDPQGRPLPGARVYLTGTTFTQGQKTSFETQTGTDGTYAVRVPDGRYSAKVSQTVTYNGTTYSFILYPLSGNPRTEVDSSEGGSLDFQWRLSGLSAYSAPGASEPTDYYGASINLSYCGLPARAYCGADYTALTPGAAPGGSQITVTLTPTGPLVDGSAGKPVVFSFPASPLRPDYPAGSSGGRLVLGQDWPYQAKNMNDIPLGTYTLTVTARLPDGRTQPLKLGLKDNDVEHTQLPIAFTPWDNFNPASYSGGGLKQLKVYVRD